MIRLFPMALISTFLLCFKLHAGGLKGRIATWWRHQMETFSASLAICAGNSPIPGEFPKQRPVTRSFGVFFDLRLNKRLSKQSWGWWLETLSRPLWRQYNETEALDQKENQSWETEIGCWVQDWIVATSCFIHLIRVTLLKCDRRTVV